MFKTNPVSLKQLLEDAHTGKIQLPDFQRGWVWDDDRIRGLLASISRRFPIGAIMTLDAGGEMRLKSRLIEGASANGSTNADAFLLDGQQRLTSLYQSLLHDGPVDTHDNRGKQIKRWYYVNMIAAIDDNIDRENAVISVPENRIETKNFGREVIRDLSSRELEYHHHMMPTELLLDPMDWLFGYSDYWQARNGEHPHGNLTAFRKSFDQSVLSAFGDYDLPVISLDRSTSKEAVCTVFEKVNTGGVTLSVFELVTATFAAQHDDFSLRDDWAERSKRLSNDYGVLQGVGGDSFLQAVALLTTQQLHRQAASDGLPQNQLPGIGCRKRDVLGLEASDYSDWADRVEHGFVAAAKFLHSQFVFTQRDVPYTTQLVPLAALYVELEAELMTAAARTKLERWYWSGIFGEFYGGAVETQFGLDLTQVAEWIRGGPEPTLVSEANFIPERLLSLRTRNSAAYKGLYALQMKNYAADWVTAEPLMLTTWHNENVDIHHIFPQAWCKRESIPPELYNSIINKTPINARSNRIIGGRAPSDYLLRLEHDMTPDRLDQVLKSHWIDPYLLRNNQFANCFVSRGEAMLELIGDAIGKSIVDGSDVFRDALTNARIAERYDDPSDEYDAVGEQAHND